LNESDHLCPQAITSQAIAPPTVNHAATITTAAATPIGRRFLSACAPNSAINANGTIRTASRDNQQVIQVAEHRDKFRDQVDWAKRIGSDDPGGSFAAQGTRGSRAAIPNATTSRFSVLAHSRSFKPDPPTEPPVSATHAIHGQNCPANPSASAASAPHRPSSPGTASPAADQQRRPSHLAPAARRTGPLPTSHPALPARRSSRSASRHRPAARPNGPEAVRAEVTGDRATGVRSALAPQGRLKSVSTVPGCNASQIASGRVRASPIANVLTSMLSAAFDAR
jgi:hypothetical protein